MINPITLIVSLRRQRLDKRINELETELRRLSALLNKAWIHTMYIRGVVDYKKEYDICEIEHNISIIRTKLARLHRKRKGTIA